MPPRGHHDATPQIRRMQALANVLAAKAGVKAPKVLPTNVGGQVPGEGYVPAAFADPRRRQILVNQNTGVQRNEFDDINPAKRAAVRRGVEAPLIGHELGHIAAQHYLGTPARGDQYLAATGQRSRDLVDPAVLAKAGAPIPGPYARDPSGLPYEGSGTVHQHANEQYAEDFRMGLLGQSPADARRARMVRILIARGLVPGNR